MASKPRKGAKKLVTPPPDFSEVVRSAVRENPGLNAAGLKKALPVNYQKYATPDLLKSVAVGDGFFVFMKNKTPLFFPREPFAEIDRRLPTGFAGVAIEAGALKEMVGELARGHAVVFEPWLKHALARRALFEHAPVRPKGKKRYGATPDVRSGLKSVLKALESALRKFDAQGVSRQQVAETLLGELGVPTHAVRIAETTAASPREAPLASVPDVENASDGRLQFVTALTALADERPREALLSVRELRPRTSLGKEQFDRIALELAREGFISLHHHDHAASLPESERMQLIEDARGTYFNGIAPRRGNV